MKRLYFLLLLVLSINTFGQITSVSADVGVGLPFLTNTSGSTLNANALTLGQLVDVNLPIDNNSLSKTIPDNTASIVLDLGSHFAVNNPADLATAPLSAYFSWSLSASGTTIFGTLINTLPKNFHQTAVFRLIPISAGAAFVNGQWAIFSNNPNFELLDPNPGNNSATLTYAVSIGAGPLPVTFKDIKAIRDNCSVNLKWSVGNEVNVKRYEIETSKDGVTYVNVGQQTVANRADYTGSFQLNDQISATNIFVRVKVIDNDGSVHYSDVVTVAGTCKTSTPWVISAYPNPVTDQSYITLSAKQGVLDGKYSVVVLDNTGKTYLVKDVELSNAKTYQLNFGKVMAAGKYIIKLISKDGAQNATIEFQKL